MSMETLLLLAGFGGGVFLSPLVVSILKAIIDWGGELAEYIGNLTPKKNGNEKTKEDSKP